MGEYESPEMTSLSGQGGQAKSPTAIPIILVLVVFTAVVAWWESGGGTPCDGCSYLLKVKNPFDFKPTQAVIVG